MSSDRGWSQLSFLTIPIAIAIPIPIAISETNIVSVERNHEYSGVEGEAAAESATATVSESWPESGSIDIKDMRVRYRPGLDEVLRGITVHIKSAQKVGIVGRTGSGMCLCSSTIHLRI